MIVIYHQNNKVISVWNKLEEHSIEWTNFSITESMFGIAKMFPSSLVVWCHISQKDNLNFEGISEVFHHKKIMASYDPIANYLGDYIGYVEESPFVKINKVISYPTWQMSSCVGGIYSCVLNTFQDKIKLDTDFDYFLNSFSKQAMPNGLLCYSDPKLLLSETDYIAPSGNMQVLFKFVKQHYKSVWILLLLLDLFLYERKVPVTAFLKCLFYKKRKISNVTLDKIEIQTSKEINEIQTIDVIIPTLGRKQYLYDFLIDLNNQTHLPENVIIVEQNQDVDSESELNYLYLKQWNFKIEHTFTHQSGACNARNIALSQVKSEWIFLADDDIRIENDFLEKALSAITRTGSFAFTFNCLRAGEKVIFKKIKQWGTFGSGCSILKSEILKDTVFDTRYEFGFGEDADFGMQLRNKGYDVLYFPEPEILHLKAPIGGFRAKPKFPWQKDSIQPKPSPTVMLFKLLHTSPKQLLGYKTILFFKFYKRQTIKNPFVYYKQFKKQWKVSIKWAYYLKEQNSI